MDNKILTTLVERAVAGDSAAFDELYRSRVKAIYYRALQLLGDPQDAEDAVQEIVLVLYQGIGQLRDPKAFASWLNSVIVNRCNRMLKKRYRSRSVPVPLEEIKDLRTEDRQEFLPQEYAESEEKRRAVLELVNALPPKSRNALYLYYYEGLNCAEIAGITGTKLSTVTAYISRGRDSITRELERRYGSLEVASGALAAVPVLYTVFEADMNALLPESVARMLADRCGARLLSFQQAGGASAGPPKEPNRKMNGTTKTALLCTVLFTICGVAFHLASKGKIKLSAPPPVSEPAVIVPLSEGQIFTGDVAMLPQGTRILSGTVAFQSHSGQPVAFNEVDKLRITLYGADGEILASCVTGPDGRFSFKDRPPIDTSELRIGIVPLMEDELLATARVSGMKLSEVEGERCALNIFLTVIQTPRGDLAAINGVCGCGHVNPERIDFRSERVEIAKAQWEITAEDGATAGSGGGTVADIQALSLDNGLYTVTMSLTDIFGNETQKKMDFIIDSNPQAARQYA